MRCWVPGSPERTQGTDVLIGPVVAELSMMLNSAATRDGVIINNGSVPAAKLLSLICSESSRGTSAGDEFRQSEENRLVSEPAASPGLIA